MMQGLMIPGGHIRCRIKCDIKRLKIPYDVRFDYFGRGVPKITDAYGEKAFEIRDNSIAVILPFSFVTDVAETANGRGRTMGKTAEMVYLAIRDNPNITRKQMEAKIGVGSTTIQKSIAFLKNNGWITRMGSNKTGYWRIEK